MSESIVNVSVSNGFSDHHGNTFPMVPFSTFFFEKTVNDLQLICGSKGSGKQSIAISFLKGFYNSDFHSTLFSTIESNVKTIVSQPSNPIQSLQQSINNSINSNSNSSTNGSLTNGSNFPSGFESRAARRKSVVGSSSRATTQDDLSNIETSVHFQIAIHRGEEFNNFHLQLSQQEKDSNSILYCSHDFFSEVKHCNIFLLLYSIVDRHSFEYATKLAKQIIDIKRAEFNRKQNHSIHDAYFSSCIIIFVGNKADLSLSGSRSIIEDESEMISKEEVLDFIDSFILETVMHSADSSKYHQPNQGVVQLSHSGDVHQMNKTLENEKSKILHFEVSVVDNDVQFILNELWEKIRMLHNTELEAKLMAKFKQWNTAALEATEGNINAGDRASVSNRSRRKSVLQDLKTMFRKSLGLNTSVQISKPLPISSGNGGVVSPRSAQAHSAPVTPHAMTPATTPSSTGSVSALEEAAQYHDSVVSMSSAADDARRTRRLSLLKNMANKKAEAVEDSIVKPTDRNSIDEPVSSPRQTQPSLITSPRSASNNNNSKEPSSKRGFFGLFKKK